MQLWLTKTGQAEEVAAPAPGWGNSKPRGAVRDFWHGRDLLQQIPIGGTRTRGDRNVQPHSAYGDLAGTGCPVRASESRGGNASAALLEQPCTFLFRSTRSPGSPGLLAVPSTHCHAGRLGTNQREFRAKR